ncbi:hypothetical protein CPB84DRAFT_1851235 [Gymnopilus junonius]|uniref:Uncharacterized protein n=1 Tax=Gymnopilus junonius TaxID=109634 RepID=A0A9P5NE79_GYMJU|nr:hypothetical protein CPB84DRAFT_1851235 [Gymnopilus junonius]
MAAHTALYILSSAGANAPRRWSSASTTILHASSPWPLPLLVLMLLVSPSPLATHPGIYDCIVDARLVVGSTLAGAGCDMSHPPLLLSSLADCSFDYASCSWL